MSNNRITMNFYGNVGKINGGLSSHLVQEIKSFLITYAETFTLDDNELRMFNKRSIDLLFKVLKEVENNETE